MRQLARNHFKACLTGSAMNVWIGSCEDGTFVCFVGSGLWLRATEMLSRWTCHSEGPFPRWPSQAGCCFLCCESMMERYARSVPGKRLGVDGYVRWIAVTCPMTGRSLCRHDKRSCVSARGIKARHFQRRQGGRTWLANDCLGETCGGWAQFRVGPQSSS